MTVQVAILILGMACLSVGVVRDVTRSEQDKGSGEGPLGGALRPLSWAGFTRGLPWYVVGGLLVAVVAWGSW